MAIELAVGARSLEGVARVLAMEPLSTVFPVRLVSMLPTRLPFVPKEEIRLLPALVPMDEGPDELFLVPNRELPPPIPIPMLPLARAPVPMELPVREFPRAKGVPKEGIGERVRAVVATDGGLSILVRLEVDATDPPEGTRLVDGPGLLDTVEGRDVGIVGFLTTGVGTGGFETGIAEVFEDAPFPQTLCTSDLAEERKPNLEGALAFSGNSDSQDQRRQRNR